MGSEKDKNYAPFDGEVMRRESRESACYGTDDEEELDIQLGPKVSIKQHLENDKDDESLRRWKAQLLAGVNVTSVAETMEPDVKILSLTIVSAGRDDIVIPLPESFNPNGLWFTLKEGSRYRLRFSIKVGNDIVCDLKYTNTVWKSGIKVDSSKQMLGTFRPQAEPYLQEMPYLKEGSRYRLGFSIKVGNCILCGLKYTMTVRKSGIKVDSSKKMLGTFRPQAEPYLHEMPEDTTPSGMFARESYSARTKLVDDDNKCYVDVNYTFAIQKEWQTK